ncbi:peroxisomal D3,D2-enoyl-CoA isomerase [Cordyceps fumosorosea ARSEF 2679]|uniref:Peroxisomal D3,D2-enoyl-CoA isomerase n=1 Tax=Cordyceps fumosorosea (strain ARSEF 2679) TaxID=1081104 RepID=A0A162MVP5_CORFA|nr:peroxisomal D3,D2-enoyl-CoA isomerase [Cordyceps fumosorosea ARSEF 2679]OAA71279.1 peroxisomal D3,D2-enoyl-CoA isomerase [Cordyceps fumosorosea ARSEF 2679]
MADKVINLEYRGRVALITIDNQSKLNALTQQYYFQIAQSLREIEKHDEVFVTVIMGKGRFFSAGADVSITRATPTDPQEAHAYWLQNFSAFNLNTTLALAEHPKVLVFGLNGPAVGLSAALVGHADFVYCAPHTFLLTPFSSLGLALLACGFANAVFDEPSWEAFHARVLKEVEETMGEHLNGESMTGIKALLKAPERAILEAQNSKEVMAGLQRFVKGIPQEEFRKLASGEKRHKL